MEVKDNINIPVDVIKEITWKEFTDEFYIRLNEIFDAE